MPNTYYKDTETSFFYMYFSFPRFTNQDIQYTGTLKPSDDFGFIDFNIQISLLAYPRPRYCF
jgi:hypothetical protein